MVLKAAEHQVESGASQKDIFYSSSYALVIGIENYKEKDWPSHANAVNDAVLVGNELEKQGFDVTYRVDLDLSGLENTIRRFFNNVNIDNNSRLFIWYSGNGHTIAGEGFLVPADAPRQSDPDFKIKAFPIRRLCELSKIIKAKYVYMVFDSCLSSAGFIKEISDSSTIPVASILKYPSRQYLCSCSAGKTKREDSVFRDTFIKAILNEAAVDANGDNNMKETTGGKEQGPHYGRLKDFEQGEFVFLLPGKFPGYFSDNLKDGSKGPEMIKITGGSFMMGDLQGDGFSDEKPVHEVTVKGIAVGRYEITFEEYDLFCNKKGGKKPDDNGWGRGKQPVIYVSWEDAVAYTKWLSEQTGYTYRLATEAEWEYFARAGTKTKYWWGNEIGEGNANCDDCSANWGGNSERKTNTVGLFKDNPFGIFDTVGNVWEWTCSEYTDTYIGNETKCLDKITTGGEAVVLRGGAWDETPKNCRVSHRKVGYPGERSQYIGFRVVRELE
jgi:formylglycine-generating enzyme required for sulfatase activity